MAGIWNDIAFGSDIVQSHSDIVRADSDICLTASCGRMDAYAFLFRGFLDVAYSQQLCCRIETCGLVFSENVATLISTFENLCKQVFSLDIDEDDMKG